MAPGSPVAVAGMGLVGFDMFTALTSVGAGRYEDVGDRKNYVPSGREPVIYLYSRSGIPYCAKSAHGIDSYGDYQPVVCTPEGIKALTNPDGARCVGRSTSDEICCPCCSPRCRPAI